MSDVTVITNNVARLIIEAYDLIESERAEFYYLPWDRIDAGDASRTFFRYKGELYDLEDVPAIDYRPDSSLCEWQKGWHGIVSDSFFSGILVRYCDDMESVIVGRYYC